MFKSGKFTSRYVTRQDESEVDDNRVQPHGVDLTVDKIFKVKGYSVLTDGEYAKAKRKEAESTSPESGIIDPSDPHSNLDSYSNLDPDSSDEVDTVDIDNEVYTLMAGPYIVRYNEILSVPEGHIGFVWPRSRLIRNNLFLSSAVWDSGYKGRGEGGLHVNTMTFMEKDMGIGQFVLARANTLNQYDGSHNGENL